MADKRDGGITKMEGVRRALADLGGDAKPMQIQGFLREKLGIAMSTDHISTYKGVLAKKGKGKGKAARKKPGPKPAQAAAPAAPVPREGARPAGGISLADLQAVKGLLGRLGPDQLRGLIDLLAK